MKKIKYIVELLLINIFFKAHINAHAHYIKIQNNRYIHT